jgi:hypothetical protein
MRTQGYVKPKIGVRARFFLVLVYWALTPIFAVAQNREAETAVVVEGLRDPVDKSYRRMVAGTKLFEARRAHAPQAPLRFKLLPRNKATRMDGVELDLVGDSFQEPIDLAPDNTFVLPRDARALKENASVRPNRRSGTMTWRAEIRSPGVPAGARRLGDLRLECYVGMESGLISNKPPGVFGWMLDIFAEGAAYCDRLEPNYLFFAERPVWSVTLASGARREVLSVDRLYAAASRDRNLRDVLPYCDCEVLLDRTYFVPLGDRSWPDDTLVHFEFMDDR